MRKERTSVRFIYSYKGHKPVKVLFVVPQEFLTFKFQAPHFAWRCGYDFWGLSFMLFAIGDHFSIVAFGISYHFFTNLCLSIFITYPIAHNITHMRFVPIIVSFFNCNKYIIMSIAF